MKILWIGYCRSFRRPGRIKGLIKVGHDTYFSFRAKMDGVDRDLNLKEYSQDLRTFLRDKQGTYKSLTEEQLFALIPGIKNKILDQVFLIELGS